MQETYVLDTALFEFREPKPHFINPCCFGEDFAAWLRNEAAPLQSAGFELSEIIQEDYGWGFWAIHGRSAFWVAFTCTGPDDDNRTAEWIVSAQWDPGLNVVNRLFHKPAPDVFRQLTRRLRDALAANPAIHLKEE